MTIEELFERYVDQAYPSKGKAIESLSAKKGLRIYHGVDPTSPQLHFGHATNYLFLRGLQELGHKIILLIGDFTAQIGDPTGKSTARIPLTKKQVLQNSRTYQKQAGKILDFTSKKNPAILRFNSTWLAKMSFEDVVRLASHFTVVQMMSRDMFQERVKAKREIYLHEFLYPLMQGYDSAAMDVDGEVGGSDQMFNMLVGRDLVKILKNKEKLVVTTPLLINPKTGKKLMSKSEGGYIALNDLPGNMYGKVMALDDAVVLPCFRFCTDVPLEELREIENKVKILELSMRDAKARLAKESVRMYWGQEAAGRAEAEFNQVFREKQAPSRVPTIKISTREISLIDLLVAAKLASSKSDARRLIKQGGVRVGGVVGKNPNIVISLRKGMLLQVGKRRFAKIA